MLVSIHAFSSINIAIQHSLAINGGGSIEEEDSSTYLVHVLFLN